jgi:uncharacterized protein with PIN domain
MELVCDELRRLAWVGEHWEEVRNFKRANDPR